MLFSEDFLIIKDIGTRLPSEEGRLLKVCQTGWWVAFHLVDPRGPGPEAECGAWHSDGMGSAWPSISFSRELGVLASHRTWPCPVPWSPKTYFA